MHESETHMLSSLCYIDLCETEILATSSDGGIELVSKVFVTLVLGQIKLCRRSVSILHAAIER